MLLFSPNIIVKDVMSKKFITINKDEKIKSAIKLMMNNNLREAFIVDEKDEVYGVVTLTDISKIKEEVESSVGQFVIENLITIEENETLINCRNIMVKRKIGRLPVVKDGKIIGVIREKEIRDYYYMKFEEMSEKLKHIINNIHEAVCTIDTEGTVLLWNDRAEKLYNLSSHEIIGKKLKDFFPNAMLLKVLKNRKKISNVYHSPRKGSYVVISAIPIFYKGELIGAVSSERDVTEVMELSQQLERANTTVDFLRDEVKKFTDDNFGNIIGKSPKLLSKIQLARHVAKTETTIFMTGESGTGKEVFARAIHEHSGRNGLFVPVNCSAIPSGLFESELFGYEEGAFTGAKRKGKIGVIELANGGTLFLDEIGDMPLYMQAKLLRVLQEKEFRRVGGEKNIAVNIRVISATNKDLKEMVEKGRFREDLYYRLNVVEIKLPPLRERNGDVIILVNHFLNEFCKKNNMKVPEIDTEVIKILEGYNWKGNIRELKNTVEYLVVMCRNNIITKESLPDNILNEKITTKTFKDYPLDLNEAKKRVEIETIKRALKIANGNKTKAAKLLNVPRPTLYYKLESYGIND